MQQIIIGATFVLGLLLALVAVVAFFKKMKGGSANLKFLGMELGGQGPLVFLVVGAAFVYAGFGWASTQKVAEKNQNQNQQCQVAKTEIETVHADTVKVASQLNVEVQRLESVNGQLKGAMSTAVQQQLQQQHPEIFQVQPHVVVPPSVLQEFQSSGVHQ